MVDTSAVLKMRPTDTVLFWPDGHHEFRVVQHTDKYPPPVLATPLPLPDGWETGAIKVVVPTILYFHRIGKITSKLTFSGFGFQRKQRLYVYCAEPYPDITHDRLAGIAEEFFATKRKQHD
jgi:hypothetical protein